MLCRNGKRKIIAIFCISLFIGGFVFLCVSAENIIKRSCIAEVNARINDIVNNSNDVMLAKDVFYSDYFTIYYDDNKDVSAIEANTGLINQMTLLWNTEIQNRLNELRSVQITIPAGVLTGNAVLSRYGWETEINAQVISNCAITYESKLIRAGINTTLHKLILYTEIESEVVVPIRSEKVFVTQEIILAETLIPGTVPHSFLVGENSVDYLDLLP